MPIAIPKKIECQLCKNHKSHTIFPFTLISLEVIWPKSDKSCHVSKIFLKKRYAINVEWRTFNIFLRLKWIEAHLQKKKDLLWRS